MNKFKKIVQSKTFIVSASVILIYTLAGFFLTPYLIRHYLPKIIHENLQKKAVIGNVALNPYIFKLEMGAFRMDEPDGQPILAFERLLVDFELKSLFRWAWVFREIQLDGPAVNAVIQKKGGLNLAHLGSSSEVERPKDETRSPPPRLVFESIRIINGQFTFTDQRPDTPATITLSPLTAGIANLTTLPEKGGETTLTATGNNGATAKWLGRVGLNPLIVKGHLSLQNVKSATLANFAGDKLRLSPPAGTLTVATDCTIDGGGVAAQIVLSNLSVLLNGIALALPDSQAPFLELPDARITGARLDLTGRKIDLGTITVQGGSAHLAMDEHGVLNLQRIAPPFEQGSKNNTTQPVDTRNAATWLFNLPGFEINGFSAHYEDAQRAPGLQAAIGELKGGFSAEAQTGEHPSALVKDLMIQLSNIRANVAAAEPIVRINSFTLEKGNADLVQKRLTAALIAIDGGSARIERRIDGTLNLTDLFAQAQPQENTLAKKPEKAVEQSDTVPETLADATAANQGDGAPKEGPASGKASAFQFLVDRLLLSGMQLTFWDRMVGADHPILNIDTLSASASQVDGRSTMPIELAVGIREGGRIKAAGTFDPTKQSLAAEVELVGIALPTAQPYIAPVAAIVLKSGTFSTTGSLRYAAKDTKAQTVYQGEFKVENLKITEPNADETLLGWISVNSKQLKLLLQPNGVDIGDIRVQGLIGKAIVEKNGSFNLANLIKAEQPGRSVVSKAVKPKKDGRGNGAFFYRVRRVLVKDGRITFADYNLPIPFAANIHELKGSLAGLTSVKDARSQIKIKGRVNQFGTAQIDGEVNTVNPKLFTNIGLAFRNIEMTKLTPYTGKFAGRKIDSGKLSVNLAYEIHNGRLSGDNKIVVERLKLGEKVESPTAVNVPLDLAVALLKDSNGVIDLGLPVSGDLNNPQFSFGALIGKALFNLLKKIVTSPFRAIAALIPGGENDSIDSITFEPGRADVPPPEKEKLLQLAEALGKRPQLKLVVQGRFHPEKDRNAIARRSLRNTLAVRLEQALTPQEDAGPVDFSSTDTRKALEKMFTERFGADKLKSFTAELQKAPENGEGADAGFLAKALFAQLLTVEPVTDAQFLALANARAKAIIAEMGTAQGLSAERLGTQPPAALTASESITAALSLQALQ
ncbi:MAG: DUF748 domain-containing protein [Desulfobacterales bacterium]|jgi:hypothetical protein|nr:DUF748 domain-containing protein [Desulfobacterales bacterium]